MADAVKDVSDRTCEELKDDWSHFDCAGHLDGNRPTACA